LYPAPTKCSTLGPRTESPVTASPGQRGIHQKHNRGWTAPTATSTHPFKRQPTFLRCEDGVHVVQPPVHGGSVPGVFVVVTVTEKADIFDCSKGAGNKTPQLMTATEGDSDVDRTIPVWTKTSLLPAVHVNFTALASCFELLFFLALSESHTHTHTHTHTYTPRWPQGKLACSLQLHT
jgi:hypothetical protein